MKLALTTLLLLAAALAQGPRKFARTQDNSRSPAKEVAVTIAGKAINISYSAPSVRGRTIFGDNGILKRDGTYPVWRAGADEATQFHTDAALDLNGHNVPKGDYTLWVDLDAGDWQLIVNKKQGWGTDYDKSQDVARVPMTMSKPPAPAEQFRITLASAGANRGKLDMAWADMAASVTFTVIIEHRQMSPETRYCGQCGRLSGPEDLARFGDLLICAECKNSYAQKLREGVLPIQAAHYAGFWIRALAWLIDTIILMVAGSIVNLTLLRSLVVNPRVQPGADPVAALGAMAGVYGIVYLVNLVIGCSYEAFFVSSSLCATPGKLALGLKVLRSDGGRLTFGRAVGRYFAKLLSGVILCIGFIMAGVDSEKRGLHDMICDTRVVRP